MTKRCNRCSIEKPLTDFHRDGAAKDGYYSLCKHCKAERQKTHYYRGTTEERKARLREMYLRNPESRRASWKRYRANNPEKWAQSNRDHLFRVGLKRFGLTQEQYDAILAEQNGLCAICGKPETVKRCGRVRRLHIDHDHITGKVRGLLCHACNIGIGNLKENTDLLQKAINYLDPSSTDWVIYSAGC